MNSLLHRDSDDETQEPTHTGHGEREITLGTTMILAIFFALAVFAAVFFGFGYSMGSKRSAAATATAVDAPASLPSAGGTSKPGAGDRVVVPSSSDSASDPAGSDTEAKSRPAPHQPPMAAAVAHPQPAVAAITAPALPVAQQPVVQIAAVSHQEDAQLLVSTLKRRGYDVVIHTDPHDKLLHVQVGPFLNHPQAEAMRQRLIADGFNAIVKDPAH